MTEYSFIQKLCIFQQFCRFQYLYSVNKIALNNYDFRYIMKMVLERMCIFQLCYFTYKELKLFDILFIICNPFCATLPIRN